MSDDDYQKKAFDFGADIVKQLIALSTGIVTLTITFAKDIFNSGRSHSELLLTGWIVHLVSILSGLLSHMALAGQLAKTGSPDPYASNIKIFVTLQWITFLGGTVVLVVFAAMNL